MGQAIQLAGAIIILTAYAAGLTGRWSTDALPYLVLNLVGSVILAVIAAITSNWGFLLMEGVWSIVTAWQLIKRPARNSARADTP
jgi:hypothetical protein